MFELLLAVMLAIGIGMWTLLICEIVNDIKEERKEPTDKPEERILSKLLCNALFTLVLLVFGLGIMLLLKLNGISFGSFI